MEFLIGLGIFVLLVVAGFYLFALGVKQGVNMTHWEFHTLNKDMERRSDHSYDPTSPNRRFIDKYRPGGDYEKSKFYR